MQIIAGLIIAFSLGIILMITLLLLFKQVKIATDIMEENDRAEERKGKLQVEIIHAQDEYRELKNDISKLEYDKDKMIKDFEAMREVAYKSEKINEEMSQKAFESYCEVLTKKYEEEDKEWKESMDILKDSYAKMQEKILADIDRQRAELEKIQASCRATIEAQLREQEIKKQLAFYCLSINEADKADIQVLESMKARLSKPRILSMLIWSTYFQKEMTTLCNNVLGTNVVCGIYKITNQVSGACYVGQAVDVATRWKNHAKCGLGIDTPAGNKLYAAMIKDGIWNFSWELLEACKPEELNEKERYYIELYQSYEYGMNSNKGIGGK